MPRSLSAQVRSLGFSVQDVRDIGLRGSQDSELFDAAALSDAIIVTRDRGFAVEATWPAGFTAGVVFVNLPDGSTAAEINAKVLQLLSKRKAESLLGAITVVEIRRALSRIVRRR